MHYLHKVQSTSDLRELLFKLEWNSMKQMLRVIFNQNRLVNHDKLLYCHWAQINLTDFNPGDFNLLQFDLSYKVS